MRPFRTTVNAIALAGLLAGTTMVVWAQESDEEGQALSDNQVPQAVRDRLQQLAEGQSVKITREEEGDGRLYEGMWQQHGQSHEAEVTADGGVMEHEHTVAASEVPEPVKQAVASQLPRGAEITYERKMIVLYAAEANTDGQEHEVTIRPDGSSHFEDDDDGERAEKQDDGEDADEHEDEDDEHEQEDDGEENEDEGGQDY